jgi:multifunctional methyltransferase subunit TRM112
MTVAHSSALPRASQVTEEMKKDESFLRSVHHALLDVHVLEGCLVCPDTGRKYLIKEGIPNMLLYEDEV